MKKHLFFFRAGLIALTGTIQMTSVASASATTLFLAETDELIDFRAVMNNGRVDLQWKCTGSGVSVYTLERSHDNSNFEVVSSVNAPANGNISMDFAETDFNPYPGISFYRLRTTAPNGSFSYSNIIPVNYLFAHDNINVFPNPASSGEKLSLISSAEDTDDILVVLKNSDGEEFYSKVFLSTTEKQVAEVAPGMDLPPGNYLVTASSKNFLYSKKIIIR